MNAALTIRRLSPGEFDMFKAIRLEGLALETTAFASTHAQWANLSDDEWRRHLAEPVFVAVRNGVAIGMMALRLKKPFKMAHRAVLTGVYVQAGLRGAGVAGRLLCALNCFARDVGIRQIELGVRADNTPAIRFYERHGFEVMGRVPCGYVDERGAEDEVLMVSHLARKFTSGCDYRQIAN